MIKVFISGNNERIKNNHIISVTKIEYADIVIGDVSIGDNNTFEPNPKVIIDLAKANSLNKLIVTFGYDLKLADERAQKLGIKTNEFGLHILPNVEKHLKDRNSSNEIYKGDFLYENTHGNGMIFLNNSIVNIYDDNIDKVIESSIALYIKNIDKNINYSKLKFFNNEQEVNDYINTHYKDLEVFNQIKISDKLSKNELSEEEKRNNYLIGDDVFFISTDNQGTLLKEKLLISRDKSNKKFNINNNTPAEFSEQTSYDLNKVMMKNNDYAEQSKTFQANLKRMPLENIAVDAGSLYELVLSLESGGKGVVNVSKNINKEKEVYKYLKEKQKEGKLDIIIDGTNQEMSEKLNNLLKTTSYDLSMF